MVPKQNADTCPDADTVLTQLIHNQDLSERLAGAVSASNRVAQQCKCAIFRANPGISVQEVDLCFIEFNYGQALADNMRTLWLETNDPSDRC